MSTVMKTTIKNGEIVSEPQPPRSYPNGKFMTVEGLAGMQNSSISSSENNEYSALNIARELCKETEDHERTANLLEKTVNDLLKAHEDLRVAIAFGEEEKKRNEELTKSNAELTRSLESSPQTFWDWVKKKLPIFA